MFLLITASVSRIGDKTALPAQYKNPKSQLCQASLYPFKGYTRTSGRAAMHVFAGFPNSLYNHNNDSI